MADSKEAWEQVGEQFAALGKRLRDPEFHDDVRKAARSLGDALTASLEEARRRLGGPRPGE